MSSTDCVLLVVLVFSNVNSKIYNRCQLAHELKTVHNIPDHELATWVCIAKHESSFDTSAVNRDSGDHGLFQISQLFWCSPPGNAFACNLPCAALRDDDITDDVACIRTIYKEHKHLSGDGFNAWVVYPRYCKGDVSRYTEGCFGNFDNSVYGELPNFGTVDNTTDDDGYDFPPLPKRKPQVYDQTTPSYENHKKTKIESTFPVRKTTQFSTTSKPQLLTTLKSKNSHKQSLKFKKIPNKKPPSSEPKSHVSFPPVTPKTLFGQTYPTKSTPSTRNSNAPLAQTNFQFPFYSFVYTNTGFKLIRTVT